MTQEKSIQADAVAHSRTTNWYVYLFNDARANAIVASMFGGEGYEDRLRRDVCCRDGIMRNLWSLTHAEASAVVKSCKEFSYRAEIYVQEGSGLPRKHVDLGRLRRMRSLAQKMGKKVG